MTDFSNFFTENNFLKKEEPIQPRQLIEAQKDLLQAGFQQLPENFISFLKISNGLQTEAGTLLGVYPKNTARDISAFNQIHNRSTQKIILGYDDLAFLVYDFRRQSYLLIDRHDGLELDDFLTSELPSALISVLHA